MSQSAKFTFNEDVYKRQLSVCRYINCDSFYDEDANKEDMWEKAHDMLKSMGYVDFNIDCTDEISFDNALRTLVNALGYKPVSYTHLMQRRSNRNR